jgi:hypothetical protein
MRTELSTPSKSEARTLFEAVGLAIDRFGRCKQVQYEPKGLHESTVEPRDPGTQDRLTRKTFDAWLRRPGGSPADTALKTRFKGSRATWREARRRNCWRRYFVLSSAMLLYVVR